MLRTNLKIKIPVDLKATFPTYFQAEDTFLPFLIGQGPAKSKHSFGGNVANPNSKVTPPHISEATNVWHRICYVSSVHLLKLLGIGN
jgi:hypothetical protein